MHFLLSLIEIIVCLLYRGIYSFSAADIERWVDQSSISTIEAEHSGMFGPDRSAER